MKKKFTEIVCNVLANECSMDVINAVLAEFLPNYEKLNLDYTNPPNDENYEFKSEEEMIHFFIKNKEFSQAFYWNKYSNNPDRISVGANFTDDDKLIISLTFNGTKETIQKYYTKLKVFLNSEIGVISHFNPADYENGRDFTEKYQNVEYDFDIFL